MATLLLAWDYTIKVWNQHYNVVSSHTNYSAVLSIVSGLKNKTIKIWECHNNYKSLQCIKIINGHTGGVLCH
jgi:hypothetical protein